jgi:hypothetical protein
MQNETILKELRPNPYWPPEHFPDLTLSSIAGSSDIFSLSMVIYFVLLGHDPWYLPTKTHASFKETERENKAHCLEISKI